MSNEDEIIDPPEIETRTESTAYGHAFSVTIRSSARLSNADVILELEYVIRELFRTDVSLSRPDVKLH